MKQAEPSITADGLCWSIRAAIHEYAARHNGNQPEQITMTIQAYARIMACVTIQYKDGAKTVFGIPVVVVEGCGYHIRLAEPEIPLYEIPKEEPQIHLPPGFAAMEG